MIGYKSVEKLLYNYRIYKANISIKCEEIKELLENDGMRGISYEGISTSRTNNTSDMTGEVAATNVIDIERLKEEKGALENRLHILDTLIEGLTDTERTVITMKYIEGRQWWEIAYKLKYSERQCRNIRKEAIEKIRTGIGGI